METTVNKHIQLVIWCFLFYSLSLTSIAQNTILIRKISIDCQNKRTEDVLAEISKKGRFYFSYSSDLVQKDYVISVKEKNISVQDLIKQIFGEKILPVETGKYIILRPNVKSEEEKSIEIKLHDESTQYTITGYIIDASTGQRLSNATIYEIGKTNSVLTNMEGYYSLNISTKNDYLGLAYSRNRFKDTIIVVQPANHSINMRLKPQDLPLEQIKNKGLETFELNSDSVPQLEELTFVKFAVKKKQFDLSKNLDFIENQHFQVSLIPQIGTNKLMSGNVENNISFNILGGYSYAVKGFELGSLFNIVRENVSGVQISGFSNVVGGNTIGLQIAGFSNNNRKSVKGIQISGFSNMVLDTIVGVQISGFSNILKGKMKGVQLSGFSNISTEDVDGVQISGFNNYAHKDVNLAQITGFVNVGRNIGGAQIAGFVNYGCGTIGGVQLAGFINIAEKVNSAQIAGFANLSTKEITGVQLAGFLNTAKKVKGTQLGFINIADSVSGLSLGFLSIVRKGMHKLELSSDENFYGSISFKTGTHRFYNIFTSGVNLQNTNYWEVGYGLGTELRSKKKFYVDFDVLTSQVNEDFNAFEKINMLFKFETKFGWNLIRSSGISIGPTFNFFFSDWKDSEGNFMSKLPPYELFTFQDTDYKLCGWIGGILSLRF